MLPYVTPISYLYSGLVYHFFRDMEDEFSGADKCNPGSPGCPNGFRCPSGTPASDCVGVTGEQALHSMHARLGTIVDLNDVFWKHIGIILGQAMVIKLAFYLYLYYESRSRSTMNRVPSHAAALAPLEKAAAVDTEKASHASPAEDGAAGSKAQPVLLFAASAVAERNAELVVDKLSLQLNKTSDDEAEGKFLLQNVSASCKAGELLSIMGPSGAGKTTLLQVLSCEPTAGRTDHITGGVTLNGQPMTPGIFRDHCAYMPQQDGSLFTFISAEAHIYYAVALFRGGLSKHQCIELVDDILMQTGLYSCKTTRAGDLEHPGLSGGQRRRLSLALALASEPSVLIADEPTTGLDDAAATAIMKLMQYLAASCKLAILTTIHQPGGTVYSHMGQLLLLSKARVAYYGQASKLTEYVDSIGKPVPPGVSIAEHVLNLVNSDFASDAEVDAVIDAWQKKAPSLAKPPLKSLPPPPERPAFLVALFLLFQKMGNILIHSPPFTRNKLLVALTQSLLYGGFVAQAYDREQDDVMTLYYGSYFLFGMVLFLNIASLLGYQLRWPAFEQELKAGMYGPATYWVISGVLALIVDAFAAVVIAVPLLLTVKAPASGFFGVVMLIWGFFSFFAAVMEFAILFGKDAPMFIISQVAMHTVMTGDIFLDYETIIWPLRIVYYILPLGHSFPSALQLAFGDENAHFEGAYRLSTAPTDIRISTAARDARLNGQLFVCPDQGSCYGDNGRDVLAALGVRAGPSPARSILATACAHMVCMCVRVCEADISRFTSPDHANSQAQHGAAGRHAVWGESFLLVLAMTLVARLVGAATLTFQMNARAKIAVGTIKGAADSCTTERSALLIDERAPAAHAT